MKAFLEVLAQKKETLLIFTINTPKSRTMIRYRCNDAKKLLMLFSHKTS